MMYSPFPSRWRGSWALSLHLHIPTASQSPVDKDWADKPCRKQLPGTFSLRKTSSYLSHCIDKLFCSCRILLGFQTTCSGREQKPHLTFGHQLLYLARVGKELLLKTAHSKDFWDSWDLGFFRVMYFWCKMFVNSSKNIHVLWIEIKVILDLCGSFYGEKWFYEWCCLTSSCIMGSMLKSWAVPSLKCLAYVSHCSMGMMGGVCGVPTEWLKATALMEEGVCVGFRCCSLNPVPTV